MDAVSEIVNVQLLSTLDGTSQWKMLAVLGRWDVRCPMLLLRCFGVPSVLRAEIDSD